MLKKMGMLESEYKENKKKRVRKDKFAYYGGHQSRLGHYFRHLFQAVSYCHNKKLDIDK